MIKRDKDRERQRDRELGTRDGAGSGELSCAGVVGRLLGTLSAPGGAEGVEGGVCVCACVCVCVCVRVRVSCYCQPEPP